MVRRRRCSAQIPPNAKAVAPAPTSAHSQPGMPEDGGAAVSGNGRADGVAMGVTAPVAIGPGTAAGVGVAAGGGAGWPAGAAVGDGA
ncbi:hypothetical protein Q9Q95_19130, partial [Sphingomonas sp. DG1-23]|nr:hypothetical protein [Sphingomonas sp. DG1-23]